MPCHTDRPAVLKHHFSPGIQYSIPTQAITLIPAGSAKQDRQSRIWWHDQAMQKQFVFVVRMKWMRSNDVWWDGWLSITINGHSSDGGTGNAQCVSFNHHSRHVAHTLWLNLIHDVTFSIITSLNCSLKGMIKMNYGSGSLFSGTWECFSSKKR